MGRIAVVTDSTCDLAPGQADELGLRMVPMTVSFGDESFVSRITISDEEFYERLRASEELPTTSQPVPAWFEEAYADAQDDGAAGVVSIHVSSALSGTCDAARAVARSVDLPIEVVDSRQVSGALALAALAAQDAAEAGGGLERVVEVARDTAERARILFVVDSLDGLRRGGRLSGAQALVGNVLRVKPILTVVDGRVDVLERARTWSKARARLAELVRETAGGRPVDLAISHALAPDQAGALHDELVESLDVRRDLMLQVGPVIGTHTGPGSLGVAVAPTG